MSHAISAESVCKECGEEYDTTSRRGYCSKACMFKKKGRDFLDNAKHDHRICASCMNRLKSTSCPDDSWLENKASRMQIALGSGATYHAPEGIDMALDATECPTKRATATDAVIGFQYSTQHATDVTRERDIANGLRKVDTGLGCECGICDHRDEFTRLMEIKAFCRNVVDYCNQGREEGQHNYHLDLRELVESIKADCPDPDIERCVGECLVKD